MINNFYHKKKNVVHESVERYLYRPLIRVILYGKSFSSILAEEKTGSLLLLLYLFRENL